MGAEQGCHRAWCCAVTKPRFTPDPLPDGLDPSLASFLQRQFDRINDWWPKDLEDRVKALEKSYPYIGGTWPIVDYSTVEFNGSATAQQVFAIKGYIYSNTGTQAHFTEGDYDEFDPVSISITGLNSSFNFLLDNEEGQSVAMTWANVDSTVSYTADGETWSSVNPGADIYAIRGIVWHKNKWYIAGHAANFSTGFCVMSSTDCSTWTQVFRDTGNTVFRPSEGGPLLASDGSRLLCVGNNVSSKKLAYSDDDGSTWTVVNSPSSEVGTQLFYKGNAWFLGTISRELWRSTNGATGWTKVLDLGGNGSYWRQIEYGGGRYLLIGSDNNLSQQDYIRYSSDGISWTVGEPVKQVDGPWPLDYDDTYGWFWANDDEAKYSRDGITWTNANIIPLGFSARGFLRVKRPL